MFLFKRKEIILDCFTNNKTALDFAPIQKASNYYPSWFNSMPIDVDGITHKNSTLKRCEGFINYYRNGLIMPLWSDLGILIQGLDYKWNFADNKSIAMVHGSNQWDAFVNPKEYGHLKIVSPWHFKCNKEIDFLFKRPYWNFDPFNDISIIEGIINFKYQHTTNINLFLKINQFKQLLLKYNEPLLHILPLTEYEIKVKNHLIDDKELNNIFGKQLQIVARHIKKV